MTRLIRLISIEFPMIYRCIWLVPVLLSMVIPFSGDPARGAEHTGDPAELDLQYLRTEVLRIHDAIRYLNVTYQLNTHVDGDDLSTERVSTHHLVVHDAVRYRENLHGRTSKSTFLDMDHGIQMWCPQQMATYEVKNRVLKIASAKYASPYSWKVRYDRFMIYTGWWPAADAEEPPASRKQLHVHLRHILSSPDYRIRNGRENINGVSCVVIESNDQSDVIWLDPDRGFVICRRITSAPESGRMLEEYTASEFACHALPGTSPMLNIWIPERIDVKTSVDADASTSFRSILTVKKISFETPPMDGIDFEPDKGTLIWNMDTGTTLATPGGIELLDENVRRACRLAAARANRDGSANRMFSGASRSLIATSLALLGLAANIVTASFATFAAFRYLRRRARMGPPQISI